MSTHKEKYLSHNSRSFSSSQRHLPKVLQHRGDPKHLLTKEPSLHQLHYVSTTTNPLFANMDDPILVLRVFISTFESGIRSLISHGNGPQNSLDRVCQVLEGHVREVTDLMWQLRQKPQKTLSTLKETSVLQDTTEAPIMPKKATIKLAIPDATTERLTAEALAAKKVTAKWLAANTSSSKETATKAMTKEKAKRGQETQGIKSGELQRKHVHMDHIVTRHRMYQW